MKSIYLRNFTATALLILICLIIVSGAFVVIGRSYVIDGYKDDMYACAKEMARVSSAVYGADKGDTMFLNMAVSSVGNSTGNHVIISDSDGVVVCCSDSTPVCRHQGMKLSEGVMAWAENDSGTHRYDDLDGFYSGKKYIMTAPIVLADSAETVGYVFVSNDIDNILGAWNTFRWMILAVAVLVLSAAMVTTLLYSRMMTRPLDEMSAASRKFARGDFSTRIKQTDDTTAEMGALIESFNNMADSLESAEDRRSEFIANISHELRTPMTTISGFADGILDGTIPKEEEKKYLTAIRDETRRLSRLVRDMLDASQMRQRAADPARRSVFDLTELVLQTLLSFESRATKKNLDVDPQVPDGQIMVVADKDAITQVIYNLVDNAIKFAHEGTCITLRLYKDDYKAYFSIKDVGETIPPDDLPFIFDRFHKSDRSRSLDKDGVGLGLYLVKSIINSHDEDIAVRSEDGKTEFVFTLSLAESAGGKKKKEER